MTKKELLEILEQVDDDAIMFVGEDKAPTIAEVVGVGVSFDKKRFSIIYKLDEGKNEKI